MENGKWKMENNSFRFLWISLCSLWLIFVFALTSQGQIAVKGETVWTMAGEQPITNGVVSTLR